MPTILWFRRDLRLTDHPALLAACDGDTNGDTDGDTDGVLPLFVVDPRLWDAAGDPRRAHLAASLRDLRDRLDGRLTVRAGDPVEVVPQVVREAEATEVHITADCGPYGSVRHWVPEVDQPGYPEPIVDHAAERREALDRWEQIK